MKFPSFFFDIPLLKVFLKLCMLSTVRLVYLLIIVLLKTRSVLM